MVSSIPSMPEYPGMSNGNYGFQNRIPEFQQTDLIQETLQSSEEPPQNIVIEESIVGSEEVKRASSPKVKTSSRTDKPSKAEASRSQRSNKNKGNSPVKKRRNPWISN